VDWNQLLPDDKVQGTVNVVSFIEVNLVASDWEAEIQDSYDPLSLDIRVQHGELEIGFLPLNFFFLFEVDGERFIGIDARKFKVSGLHSSVACDIFLKDQSFACQDNRKGTCS